MPATVTHGIRPSSRGPPAHTKTRRGRFFSSLLTEEQGVVMSTKRNRRQHRSDQKAALLKRHHLEKVPVSDLCEEAEVQPSVFYYWQKQLFENAATVFDIPKRKPSREQELEERIRQLEARVARKDQVIAEVTEELVRTKKELGDP